MVIKKAIEIAKDIHSEETEVEDKLTAIQDIIELRRNANHRTLHLESVVVPLVDH